MSIDPVSSATLATLNAPGSTASASSAAASSQKDEFMKLLVAQLQNQDPLNPQQGAEFVSQLAQFSALEQATTTNDKLDTLASAQTATTRADMAAMVGRTITANVSSLKLETAGTPPLKLHLDGAAKTVEVDVLDSSGNKIRTMQMGAQPGGDLTLAVGQLPAGTYTVQVKAAAAGGAAVNGEVSLRGIVQSLNFQSGNTVFNVGGVDVAPGDILSIGN